MKREGPRAPRRTQACNSTAGKLIYSCDFCVLLAMSSPRSPKMGDDVDKQLKYQMEKMEHELEMEKVKVTHLEDDNERLKGQLADGEKRHKKIDKVHAMIKEFQIQIEEAT